MATNKARKVRAIHADCPACGTTVVVNAESGEIEGIAKLTPDSPPAPAPNDAPANDAPAGETGEENPPASSERSSFLSDW